MAHPLRRYQTDLKHGIYDAWNRGARCIMGVTATGSGKTVVMADMASELPGRGVIEAHRSELVGQISNALAEAGMRHNITAAKKTITSIVKGHMEAFGKTFYDPRAPWTVASVDTIIRREDPLAKSVNYLFQDEGHHTLRLNKWGRAADQYPNAKVLLMTATACRADGQGLGSHHDGIADGLVIGPGLGDLVRDGYLVNYKVFTPHVADLNLSDVHIGASGEFNQAEVATAVKRSRLIVGDVVRHYCEITPDKLAIVFAVDIEHAETLTAAFNAGGVSAALVTADTEETDRREIMKKFRAREILVLVNVDLFGEGVDVAGVEVVIMARPTASFALYAQMIGRMLRLNISKFLMGMWDTFTVADRLLHIAQSAKPFAVLIDHVGNVRREYNIGGIKYSGLPEGFTAWSMDRRARRNTNLDDGIPMRPCTGCFKKYERFYDACPFCGVAPPEPTQRNAPEFVDGDLHELDPLELAKLRQEIARVDAPVLIPQALPPHARTALIARHAERQREQHHLREAMALWAGAHYQDPDSVNYKRFYLTFKIDVASAMSLNAKDAAALRLRIEEKLA